MEFLYFILILVTHQMHICAIEIIADFSQSGIYGRISFTQSNNKEIIIQSVLNWTLLEDPPEVSWMVCEFPVDYTQLEERCNEKKLGNVINELDSLVGPLSLNDTSVIITTVDKLSLSKERGIWGRSLLLKTKNGLSACATFMNNGKTNIKMAEARLNGAIAGSVYFQWLGTSGETDSMIYTDLYHTRKRAPRSQHKWKIFTTDVLDSEADKSIKDCNSLQVLYEPHGHGSGNLVDKLGPVSVGMKEMFRDAQLSPLDLYNKQRHLYLVIFDNHHLDSYLICARIVPIQPINLKSIIKKKGLNGYIVMQQSSPFVPTSVTVNWTSGYDVKMGGLRIHELPASPSVSSSCSLDDCLGIGDVYNPTNKPIAADSFPPGEATQDEYAVGDLSGKLGYNLERPWDSFLPLRGKHSVRHRSLVIYRNDGSGVEVPWICSTLLPYSNKDSNIKQTFLTAEALFRYPLAGRIIFRQPQEDPIADTTILVEILVHADGTSLNDTHEHRWGINLDPPGKDFYNWSDRCVSAGPTFDPYQILTSGKVLEESCNKNSREGFCRVGSLSERLGSISIAGSKANSVHISRKLFTDTMTPLSGQYNVVGKSLVLYDDHGPKARGERLACSKISYIFRRKGVVREWFGNGVDTTINGKIEIIQQTEYDGTDLEFSLGGIHDAAEYHIHYMPVKEHLEFPCEESTLYNTYDPCDKDLKGTPLPGTGTYDEYAVGDLSGKFGRLDDITHLDFSKNDSTIMLFGQNSILSRSVVVFKKDGSRWSCGTIERGYSPSEARELRAIASFHHPNGFAYGYIRMTQLINKDSSPSDTIIEVSVRHPGKMDRNITLNHNWAIFVNPVGVDATVKVLDTRCTAGGYVWNPYYTQLADPLNDELYRKECGPDHPFRCYVGDISGRLGTISVGGKKRIFSDPNFPLEGTVSALGKSIVIFDKDRGHFRFACANIEPDNDLIKYVNVRRPPKFIVSQFLEDVRTIMGVPEWFITIDTRHTKLLHNGACIQLLLHFKGSQANKLEKDFSVLLSTGKLDSPSLNIPGYIQDTKRKSKISYKLCGSGRNRGKEEFSSRGYGFQYDSTIKTIITLSLVLIYVINM